MKRNWLVPVDGSAVSLKPVTWLVMHLDDWKEAPAIHLLNVQPALPQDIGRFIAAEQLRDYHREEGRKALAAAEQQLKAAGLEVHAHVAVGEVAETIVDYAAKESCDQILIGTRGHTGLGGTLLGSAAAKVAHLTQVPLLLIR